MQAAEGRNGHNRNFGRSCQVSFFFIILPLFLLLLLGCSQFPKIYRKGERVEENIGAVAFSASVKGEAPEAVFTVGPKNLLLGHLLAQRVVFSSSPSENENPYGVPVIVLVRPGKVEVCLERVGDFWDFTGGRPYACINVSPREVVYLGTLLLEVRSGVTWEIRPILDDRRVVGALPRSPAHDPPRKIYGSMLSLIHI